MNSWTVRDCSQSEITAFTIASVDRVGMMRQHCYLPQYSRATQHSCGDENNNCEVIIQYMCAENVRNGRTTNTPPIIHTACRDRDCDTDERFGMHESLRHFQKCQTRERNKGLYTATQVS